MASGGGSGKMLVRPQGLEDRKFPRKINKLIFLIKIQWRNVFTVKTWHLNKLHNTHQSHACVTQHATRLQLQTIYHMSTSQNLDGLQWQIVNQYVSTGKVHLHKMLSVCDLDLWTHDLEDVISVMWSW